MHKKPSQIIFGIIRKASFKVCNVYSKRDSDDTGQWCDSTTGDSATDTYLLQLRSWSQPPVSWHSWVASAGPGARWSGWSSAGSWYDSGTRRLSLLRHCRPEHTGRRTSVCTCLFNKPSANASLKSKDNLLQLIVFNVIHNYYCLHYQRSRTTIHTSSELPIDSHVILFYAGNKRCCIIGHYSQVVADN